MRIFKILILTVFFWGCKKDDTFLIDQRTSFENYLTKQNLSYTVSGGVFRHVTNADREGYDQSALVEYGDSVTFDFAAYLYGSPLGNLYFTNVKEWLPSSASSLNTEYWPFVPQRILLGRTQLIKGLTYGLVGSHESDSLLLFMTSDLCYGSHNVGVVQPDAPTVWSVKINKVVKP